MRKTRPLPIFVFVVRNSSRRTYAFVTGMVTFYDGAGVLLAKDSSKQMRWRLMKRLKQTPRESHPLRAGDLRA